MTEPSLFDALASRDHGAQLAADSVHTSWRLAAEAVIRRLAARGGVFTSDDVCEIVGRPPGHGNAVGGLFIAASRRGEIQPAGYRPSQRPEAHARILRCWRGA